MLKSVPGLVLVVVILGWAPAPAWSTAASPTVDPVLVAVIDTGINASHPEFAPGQVIAYRDFTEEATTSPVDPHGHGTATASLVAGLNAASCGPAWPKRSHAPGAPLIIARVGNKSGDITGSITAAFEWSVQQGADVISMSIGSVIPSPGASRAIAAARAQGVVVVLSAGNGLLNAGVAPSVTWTHDFGNVPGSIAVGGGGVGAPSFTSTTGNHDPDVVSWSDGVCVARTRGGYGNMSGTSFSSPLVAGMAVSAIEAARNSGQPDDADTITRLLLLSARNQPTMPYVREGLGYLGPVEFQNKVLPHARAGTFPDYVAQGGTSAADLRYHDEVVQTMRAQQCGGCAGA